MATLALTIGGKVLGTALGGPIGGAVGSVVGSMIGGMIDSRLFPPERRQVEGPRADSLEVTVAAEGTPLPVVQGWARVQALPIWATRLREQVNTESSGGKGAPSVPAQTSTTYRYFATVAFAVATAPGGTGPAVAHFGRAWVDRKPIDLRALGARFYTGAEDQDPDPAIAAVEGATSAPAYRGTAYIVVENWDITDYGARLPVLDVEVCRPIGVMEPLVQGVNIGPGATEWGYGTTRVIKQDTGTANKENGWRSSVEPDFTASLRTLRETLPAVRSASLIVAWFGSSLDAGACLVRPLVEVPVKATSTGWAVAGLTRETAGVVPLVDGRPAYGSTPSDSSVVEAIAALKAEGFAVTLYPFLLMDAPGFPWRGRIAPAADGTASARTAVNAFFDRWRLFLLHMAGLAQQAGGVDTLLLGGELVGLTRARDNAGAYPGVERLMALAAEMQSTGAAATIGYAADWSEYHSHRPDDGSGDVIFNLDPLWAHPAIGFVGIDAYFPLADWRNTPGEMDRDEAAGKLGPYCLDYLKGNVEGGELWDWYYASAADRAAQTRTPIIDGSAAAEHWVFRQKAVRAWWSNAHHNRPGGTRSGTPTAWVPRSKPIRWCEYGAPAIDKAANQPNVFFDPKSTESSVPHFSTGARDDFAQRQYLRAWLEYWRDHNESHAGVPLVDLTRSHAWVWDARPWPEFPVQADVWADSANYRRGHWLNGRAGSAPAAEAIAEILDTAGYPQAADTAFAWGVVDGWAGASNLTARSALQAFEQALRIDAFEAWGGLVFQARAAATSWGVVALDGLADSDELVERERSDWRNPPRAALLRFRDSYADWQLGLARAEIGTGIEAGQAEADLPLGLDHERAMPMAEAWLRDVVEGRELVAFDAPPSAAALQPGRIVQVPVGAELRSFMVQGVTVGSARRVEARSFDQAGVVAVGGGVAAASKRSGFAEPGVPVLYLMDLPQLTPDAAAQSGYLAAWATPWLGVDVFAGDAEAGPWVLSASLGRPSALGVLTADLAAGPPETWSAGPLELRLFAGTLDSLSAAEVLGGRNALAVETAGGWEVLGFRQAELIAASTWRLTGLVRGRLGTEAAAQAGAATGAKVAVLDVALGQPLMTPADINRPRWWRHGPTGRDIAGPLYATAPHTFGGRGLVPRAPAWLRGSANGLGGVALAWQRRSRVPGPLWADPPLGEETERWRVRIFAEASAVPVREAESTGSSWTYAAADRAADALGARFEVGVAQWSAVVGWGDEARATIAV